MNNINEKINIENPIIKKSNITYFVRNYKNKLILLNIDLEKSTDLDEVKKTIYDTILDGVPDNKKEKIINKIVILIDTIPISIFKSLIYLKKYIDSVVINDNIHTNLIEIKWFVRNKGGFVIDAIEAVIAIFKFMLMIPKIIIWVAEFIIWSIKIAVYLFNMAMESFSTDGIMGLVKFIAFDVITAPFNLAFIGIKYFVNWLGKQTLTAIWGVDNVPDEDSEESDFLKKDSSCGGGKKCYKTQDGTIPFSVIITTILCPPIGVFMEYGSTGWFNILICALLTIMFYFPGLIYALILLYC